jgi:demethylmenaquinone methyltransferase/2-methoxy-6-polyprenyl-1,4-benzoquinol methylase
MAADRAELVRSMFTRIARRYDLMNALMSFGRHHAWRRVAARATIAAPDGLALDLATGTADLALAILELVPHRRVIGADFSEGMLREARRKLAARPAALVALLAADALALPFADASFRRASRSIPSEKSAPITRRWGTSSRIASARSAVPVARSSTSPSGAAIVARAATRRHAWWRPKLISAFIRS